MAVASVLEPTAPQGSVLIAGVGASHGLGAAIARRFAAGGYPVVVAAATPRSSPPPPPSLRRPAPG